MESKGKLYNKAYFWLSQLPYDFEDKYFRYFVLYREIENLEYPKLKKILESEFLDNDFNTNDFILAKSSFYLHQKMYNEFQKELNELDSQAKLSKRQSGILSVLKSRRKVF